MLVYLYSDERTTRTTRSALSVKQAQCKQHRKSQEALPTRRTQLGHSSCHDNHLIQASGPASWEVGNWHYGHHACEIWPVVAQKSRSGLHEWRETGALAGSLKEVDIKSGGWDGGNGTKLNPGSTRSSLAVFPIYHSIHYLWAVASRANMRVPLTRNQKSCRKDDGFTEVAFDGMVSSGRSKPVKCKHFPRSLKQCQRRLPHDDCF